MTKEIPLVKKGKPKNNRAEVARYLGISGQMVNYIEEQAIRKMRKYILERRKKDPDFLVPGDSEHFI